MADPTVHVAPPQRRPRKGGIRAVANFAPLERAFAAEAVDWVDVACGFPQAAPGLCWGEAVAPAEKSRYGFDTGESAPIFPLYAGVECYLQSEGDTFETEARALLASGTDRAVEQKLSAYLDVLNPTPDPAADLEVAIAFLDDYADSFYVGQPVIHMARALAVRAKARMLLDGDADGNLWTANGTPVSAGDYNPFNVYVTGDVTVYESEVVSTIAIDPRHNRQMALAEQAFAFGIDCNFTAAVSLSAF